MKITLLLVGKTSSPEIRAISADYLKRINHYLRIEEVVVENSTVKTGDKKKIKESEGELLLKKITASDLVILLDDKGRELSSLQFAQYLEGIFNQSLKNVCFVVGGAYGFSEKVYKRANAKLSLSKLTFSHQIIRPIFLEQLYRAFTIIHHEPYHHE
jgi:23S rRNA (pseudouridine1915-N3)-methyltransferase